MALTAAQNFAALSDEDLCSFIADCCENPRKKTLDSLASSRHQHEMARGAVEGYKSWRSVTEKLARLHGGESPVHVWKEDEE